MPVLLLIDSVTFGKTSKTILRRQSVFSRLSRLNAARNGSSWSVMVVYGDYLVGC